MQSWRNLRIGLLLATPFLFLITAVFTYKTRRWLLGKIASVRMALVGDFVWISCQTSTPHANVTLMRKTKATDRWEKVSAKEDSGRIMQMYQNFLIKRITHKDSGFYRCNATDHRNHTILLKKGKLIVSVGKKLFCWESPFFIWYLFIFCVSFF